MNGRTQHILNASTNLVGFCFFVLVSVKSLAISNIQFTDKLTALSILLFVISAFLSFLSMRREGKRAERLERYAETVFVLGLVSILVISGLLVLSYK